MKNFIADKEVVSSLTLVLVLVWKTWSLCWRHIAVSQHLILCDEQ
jgi:hypothetical protein